MLEYRRPLVAADAGAARRAGRRCACSRSRRSSLFLFRPIAVLPPAGIARRDRAGARRRVAQHAARRRRRPDAARARRRPAEERARPAADARTSRPSCTASATASRRPRSTASRPTRAAPICPARSPPCASAIAASASPASWCSRTAATRGRVRQDGQGRRGRTRTGRRRAAGVRRRRRLARRSARSRSARHHGRRSAARSGVGRPARDRRQQRLRPGAVLAARARATASCSTRGALVPPADGSPIDEVVHRLARSAQRRPSTRRRFRATRPRRSPRTTAAACWSARPAASGALLLVEGAPGFEHSFMTRALAGRSGPRGRLGDAQGQERRRPGHVLRAGGRRPRRRR